MLKTTKQVKEGATQEIPILHQVIQKDVALTKTKTPQKNTPLQNAVHHLLEITSLAIRLKKAQLQEEVVTNL